MSLLAAVKLVKSLSSSEKRLFKLHCKRQSGDKDYLGLFDLIDKTENPEPALLKERFHQRYPNSSLDNAARYLLKLLTDCLIQSKMEKDSLFLMLQDIMRMRVFQERSLPEEAYRLLKKIRRSAVSSQQHFIEYITYRYELNYFANVNFSGLSDAQLVQTQMKAKDTLKVLNHIQDHYSLFELLKYRLIHSGKVLKDEDKKKLNDLMLSEMVLVAGKAKSSFTAQKLHLLFQSFFFTNIGDYQSALKTFHELNRLFENNQDTQEHPPLNYLSSLNGILDSLHILGKYEEISFYLNKVNQLDQPDYPEYFRYLVRKTIVVYNLAVLTGRQEFEHAASYVLALEPGLLEAYSMVSEEKQWELYFYCSLAHFGNRDLKKAHGYIREIMRDNKLNPQLLICKAIRLLDMIIHYEKGDTFYLEYEIRSYKRFFRQHGKLLHTESLILKIIEHLSTHKSRLSAHPKYKNLHNEVTQLQEDKYEKQLLKYYNFTDWIIKKYTE